MNILVTAGGTSEKIDEVRAVTNHSSGRLGKLIAEAFLKEHNTVTYITTAHALKPEPQPGLTIRVIASTQELEATLREELTTPFDAVIHSMAVSDFSPSTSLSQEQFAEKLAAFLLENPVATQNIETLTDTIKQALAEISSVRSTDKKLSSQTDRLIVLMDKTPKVISLIKQLQPQTILVGFKLLVGVTDKELLRVGQGIMVKNNCDFVLANDLEQITATQHVGLLIKPGGSYEKAQTKEEIAQLIVANVHKTIH